MDPVTVQCSQACTVTLEFSNVGNPFVMSVADGAALSALILGVWVSAVVCRYLVKTVFTTSDAD